MSDNHDKHSHHFVIPLRYYVGTLVALLFLTFITVWVAQFHFGSWNIVVALVVAFLKATLVVMFFMGLRWDKGFNVVVFLGGLMFFALFVAITVADVISRGTPNPVEAGTHSLRSPVKLVQPGESLEDAHSSTSGHTAVVEERATQNAQVAAPVVPTESRTVSTPNHSDNPPKSQ